MTLAQQMTVPEPYYLLTRGGSIALSETYGSNFIYNDVLQFGK